MMKAAFASFVATVALSAVAVWAGDPSSPGASPAGGPPGGGGPGWGGPGNRGGFQMRGGFGMIGLDDQQRELLQEALQEDHAKLRKLEEQLRAAQQELLGATLATNFEESVVRTKAEAVGKVQVEIALLHARALAKVVPTMTPEQKQRLAESPMGVMLLNGAPGGFAGGGFGNRFGGPGQGRGGPGGHDGGGLPGFPGGGQEGPRER